MIIIPSGKFLDAQDAISSTVRIGGIFGLEALSRLKTVRRKIEFAETRRSAPFHNLVVNGGLDGFGLRGANTLYSAALVGTGTTPPLPTDSTLSGLLGGMSAPTMDYGVSPGPDYEYAYIRLTWTSTVGQFGNNNLTNCGVAGASNGTNLFSSELIRDSSGNPTAFPIQNDEQLRFTYELRLYRPMADANGQIQIGSVTYDYTTRPLDVSFAGAWRLTLPNTSSNNSEFGGTPMTAYSGGLVAVTATAPTGPLGNGTVTGSPYSTGSLQRDGAAVFNPTSFNGALRTMRYGFGCSRWQVEYDPLISKTQFQTLTLPQRLVWARYTP